LYSLRSSLFESAACTRGKKPFFFPFSSVNGGVVLFFDSTSSLLEKFWAWKGNAASAQGNKWNGVVYLSVIQKGAALVAERFSMGLFLRKWSQHYYISFSLLYFVQSVICNIIFLKLHRSALFLHAVQSRYLLTLKKFKQDITLYFNYTSPISQIF